MTFEEAYPKFEQHIYVNARRYFGMARDTFLGFEDLIQVGKLGLVKALQRKDRKDGFTNYAKQVIRGAILDEIRKAQFLPRTAIQAGIEFETIHFDAPIHDNSSETFLDTYGAEDKPARNYEWLVQIMEHALTHTEFELVVARYWNAVSLTKLSKVYGVSPPRIFQQIADAKEKLRKALKKSGYNREIETSEIKLSV